MKPVSFFKKLILNFLPKPKHMYIWVKQSQNSWVKTKVEKGLTFSQLDTIYGKGRWKL